MKKWFKKTGKAALSVAAMVLTSAQASAQDITKLTGALGQTKTQMKTLFDSVTPVIVGIGGITAVITIITVVHKFQSGDPQAGKTAAAWGGGIVVLMVGLFIIGKVFF